MGIWRNMARILRPGFLRIEGLVASPERKELLTQLRPHLNLNLSPTHHTFYKWPPTLIINGRPAPSVMIGTNNDNPDQKKGSENVYRDDVRKCLQKMSEVSKRFCQALEMRHPVAGEDDCNTKPCLVIFPSFVDPPNSKSFTIVDHAFYNAVLTQSGKGRGGRGGGTLSLFRGGRILAW